jgi:tripartite-type tricarboxylate transporter receptor subunit TctC
MRLERIRALILATPIALASALPASAATVADFYRGQTVTLLDFSSGGGSDVLAHIMTSYLQKYIPGHPIVVVKSMIGAAGLLEANYMYNSAPRDGTVFGMLNRGTAFAAQFGAPHVQFDPLKFNWIGNATHDVLLGVSWGTSPVKSIADAIRTPLIIGATAPDGETAQVPLIVNATTGTKFKIVNGYAGGSDINMAMERGEVGGRVSLTYSDLSTTKPDWLRDKKINILFQSGLKRDPRLPNVPLAIDYAKGPLERRILELLFSKLEMSRPYALPPDVPPERTAALRQAFSQTMADKAFLAACAASGLEISWIDGDDTRAIVERAVKSPPEVTTRIREILGGS